MRTKFTVVFEARFKHTCKDICDRTGKPWHQKDELVFRDNYYYLGDRIDDCLKAFWAFACYHGYTNRLHKDERTYEKYITICEVFREEKPDDYTCGHCDSMAGGKLVVTQITSDMIIHMWSPEAYKYNSILCPEPHKMPNGDRYCLTHYGKGMENLKIGDEVELTCEIHSLISGICNFYNPTGRNDMKAAKQMHQYAIDAENRRDCFGRPGKFTRDYFEVLKRKGIKPVVIDALQ